METKEETVVDDNIVPPDQIVSIGYESFNPYLNLGTVVLMFFLYALQMIITFVILWPLSKLLGYDK